MNRRIRPVLVALPSLIFSVVAIAQGQDRVLWRFEMDSAISGSEVSVGPDGAVYASDVTKLYALNPDDGSVRWTTTTVRDNTPIAFLPDGALITRLENTVFALEPDGSTRWTFSFPSNGLLSQIEVGPSVGPDGNIYAVSSIEDGGYGLGAFSLTPDGVLRWSDPGDPPLALINSHTGGPVYFTQERLIFPFAVVVNGAHRVHGFDFDGNQRLYVDFTCLGIPRTDPLNRLLLASPCGIEAMEQDGNEIYWRVQFSNVNLAPAIGADATAYAAAWFGDVNAINPDGTILWTSSTATDAVRFLAVRQDVGRLVYSGATNFGVPDFVSGVDTGTGELAWTVDMMTIDTHNEGVWTQRAPTSSDGSVVYFATRFTSNGAPGALYAVRVTDAEPVDVTDASHTPALRPQLTVSPNPAPGGRLTVGFETTGGSGAMDVAIFSVTGARVRSLHEGPLADAAGRVEWDGRDDRGHPVTAGTYFARLQDGSGRSVTRRVTVIP